MVYAEGDVTFAQALGALLLERNMKLATAESCTGGLVGEILTERGGSSEFYAGGIVAYENSVKEQVLGVPAAMLAQYGAVSPEVARAMAEGALRVVGANVAVAFTGIAGPGGGTPEKPVGTVCYAVATRDGTVDRQMVFPGSRTQVRQLAAFAGLALVRSVLRRGLDA